MNFTLNDNINNIYGDEKVNHAKEDIYHLWQECFGDSKEYTDFYFKWKVKDNQILTIYKKDSLCSMLHLNPYILSVREQQLPINYIVGVATQKDERRQGLMKILLEKALHQMYQENMPFTYLMPAAEAIYSPYDFRVVYEQKPWNKIMKATIQNLREQHKNDYKDIVVKPLSIEDKDCIEELTTFCNDRLSKDYDIYVHRTPNYYERLIHEMKSGFGEVLVCYKGDQILGYLSYMAEDAIYITEMITNQKGKDTILQALGAYFEDNIKKRLHEDKEHKTTTIMVRIVDFRTFIKSISATEEMHIIMKVVDDIIQENNGIYQLNFTKEGCHVTTTTEEPEITLNIADVTRLFFGGMNKEEYHITTNTEESEIILSIADVTSLSFGRMKKEEFIKQGSEVLSSIHNKSVIDKLDKVNKKLKVFINDVV